jgi:hypothetical protein
MRLLCISIQAPSTPDPSFLHVCLLSFVLSESPFFPLPAPTPVRLLGQTSSHKSKEEWLQLWAKKNIEVTMSGWGHGWVIEFLPGMHKALSLIPNTKKSGHICNILRIFSRCKEQSNRYNFDSEAYGRNFSGLCKEAFLNIWNLNCSHTSSAVTMYCSYS